MSRSKQRRKRNTKHTRQSGEKCISTAQQRIRVVRRTITVMVIICVGLVILRFVMQCDAALRPTGLFFEMAVNEQSTVADAPVDPLGISSSEIVFQRGSDDGLIIWYSSAAATINSQALIDQALRAQGWIACSGDDRAANSYVRLQPNDSVAKYLMVLYYEQNEGCEIIVEVI